VQAQQLALALIGRGGARLHEAECTAVAQLLDRPHFARGAADGDGDAAQSRRRRENDLNALARG